LLPWSSRPQAKAAGSAWAEENCGGVMVKRATFETDGDVIHITNSYGRARFLILIVIAMVLLALPFVRPYLPDGFVEFEKGEEPWILYLLGICGCLSAAFWWSVVTLDPKADQVEILRRWGLWCSKRRRALSSYDSVTLREDSDGNVSVYLENGSARDWSIETNNDRAIVWGRTYEEALDIAVVVARRLSFRLHDDVWAERNRLPSRCT
jgi:hypothetical protein